MKGHERTGKGQERARKDKKGQERTRKGHPLEIFWSFRPSQTQTQKDVFLTLET